MKVINSSARLVTKIDRAEVMSLLEHAGRVCYKSEGNIGYGTADKFIAGIIARGHESVIEHYSITVHVICDRGVSHELVRHRIASYSQESTRYCNYSAGKFGNELTFIAPCFWTEESPEYAQWRTAMEQAESAYLKLLAMGAKPEQARSVLPNSLKTELYVTMNLREWRHFLRLRTSPRAHPQMRELALQIKSLLSEKLPIIFEDI